MNGISNEDHIEHCKSLLENCDFETRIPTIFFKCESAVFVKDDTNSLCYTTSEVRSEVLTSILNEWAKFRRAKRSMIMGNVIRRTIEEFNESVEILIEFSCEDFAKAVAKKVPGAKAVWDIDIAPEKFGNPLHCFIQYGEKFYDASCPSGVTNWSELPFYEAFITGENRGEGPIPEADCR